MPNRSALFSRLLGAGVGFAASIAAVFLVVPHEGEVLGSYVDVVGVATACYGSTGSHVELGASYSRDECLAMLSDDLAERDRQLQTLVTVPLEVHQHAAFLSFLYNVGAGNFAGSTLLTRLNAGDYAQACDEMLRWVWAGGRDCRLPESNCGGIPKRRVDEWQMCHGRTDISDYLPAPDLVDPIDIETGFPVDDVQLAVRPVRKWWQVWRR